MSLGGDRDRTDSVKFILTTLTFPALLDAFIRLSQVAVFDLGFAVDADPVNVHWPGVRGLWLVLERRQLADLANEEYVGERVVVDVLVGTRILAVAHFDRSRTSV